MGNTLDEEKTVDAKIVSIDKVMNLSLEIPNYQRPYRWETENVRQMLEDILYSMESKKQNYRIGSVILHKKDDKYYIVDGQQRLTTLCLLKKACGKEIDEKLKFNHNDSFAHIRDNYKFIESWINETVSYQKEAFWNYTTESCSFVQIIVTDLSEAFQMFDSQNGRGKELEAYNLLKAYHIRAMEQNSQEEKVKCDKQWESATLYDATPTIIGDADGNIDILKQLFDEQLYRSRVWSKRDEAYEFSKKEIKEFKGFTIDKNHPAVFPYQNPQLLQYLTSKFYKNVLEGTISTQTRFLSGDGENINPFVSINQNIVNGKTFFDYIETYVEIYKRMFIDLKTYQLSEFKSFFYKYCLNYGGNAETLYSDDYAFYPKGLACRSGDSYLRELYKSLIFVLFDKFGEKCLNKYYKILYRLVYLNRLTKRQVRYNSVAELPIEYFDIINQAKELADLSKLQKLLEDRLEAEKTELDNFNNFGAGKSEIIINFIKKGEEVSNGN